MANSVYPPASRELSQKRRTLAPTSKQHSMPSARESSPMGPDSEDQVGLRCRSRARHAMPGIKALRHGATPEELMEAIWVAAEMRAGGAHAHSAVSLVAMDEAADRAPSG
jgi:hypothetical protein